MRKKVLQAASNNAQQVEALQKRLDEVLRANENLVYSMKKKEQSICSYKSANTKYRNEIETIKASLSESKKKNSMYEAKLAEQKSLNIRLTRQIGEMQEKLTDYEKDAEIASEHILRYKKQYEAFLALPWYKRIFIK